MPGRVHSGFRAEVEAERALGQLDDMLDYFDERRAGVLAFRTRRTSGRRRARCGRRRRSAPRRQ